MNITEVLDVVDINEDAFSNTTWNKKVKTEDRVRKGKMEHIGNRKSLAKTEEGKAKEYTSTMVGGKKDNEGKFHEYSGSKVMMGLPMTDKGRNNYGRSYIEDQGTSRFEIIKKLYSMGKIKDSTVKRSKQLTDEQKKQILGDKYKIKEEKEKKE